MDWSLAGAYPRFETRSNSAFNQGVIIRNQSIDLAIRQARKLESPESPTVAAAPRAHKARGSVSGTTIATYLGVFLFVVSVIALAYHPPAEQVRADASNPVASAQKKSDISPVASVDQLVATKLASSLAESTDMPVSNNVANLSQSLAVESALAQTDSSVISKPQIVQLTSGSRTLQAYTTAAGDTVQSVAEKYGLSVDTVKWANNLTSDALNPGTNLTILPLNGIVYTVKAGDTVDAIATKYSTDRASVVSYNDLELAATPAVGAKLILPGGVLPANERPGYVAPRVYSGINYGNYSGGSSSAYMGGISAGNKYAWGNCTWYVYERRMQLGRPIGSFWGNASTWAYNAQRSGFTVNGTPAPGAIMANGGGYGHVSVVESVNPGVSITISEMNGYRFGGGFARVGRGDISWGEATSGYYKYIH